MSRPDLDNLLKNLAELVKKDTEEYRKSIDIKSPTIVSLSYENLKDSLSLIISAIEEIKGNEKGSLEKIIISTFKKSFLEGRKEELIYSTNLEFSTDSNIPIYFKNLDLFYVYKDGTYNGYKAVQRRIEKATQAINKLFEKTKETEAIKDILYGREYTYEDKQGKLVTARQGMIQTGHLYIAGKNKKGRYSTTTPVLEKIDSIDKTINSILEKLPKSDAPKSGSIIAFRKALNNLKSITLQSTSMLLDTHKKDAKILLSAKSRLKINLLGKLEASKEFKVVILLPESSRSNTSKSSRERAALRNLVKSDILNYLESQDVTSITASKSIKKAVEDHLVETLLEGKGKGYSSDSKASRTELLQTTTKVKVNKKVTSNVSIKPPKTTNKPTPIRNVSGQFTSLPKILAMLQGNINQQVASNMGSPRLNYRKGRFANSVRIKNVNKSDKGQWTITYSYMTYPYQTFEPGYAQGSNARDPRALITLSIRELVAKEIGNKFRAVRIGGAGSLGRIK